MVHRVIRYIQSHQIVVTCVTCVTCPDAAPPEDFLPTCDAFAHWAYEATGGRTMVTDVQGWYDSENNVAKLTDPCLHCTRQGLLDDQYKDRGLVSV